MSFGHLDLSRVVGSGEYSDMKLVCQGCEFKVHKVVVCTQSPVLAKAIQGVFQESRTGIINIENFEPSTVSRMVEFLYTGDYGGLLFPHTEASRSDEIKKPALNDITASGMMLQHVQVNAIADYYNIERLSELSRSKFQQACQATWDAQSFMDATNGALDLSGDGALHEVIATEAAKNIHTLLEIDHFAGIIGDFGTRVLRNCIKKAEVDRYKVIQLQLDLEQEHSKLQAAEARVDRIIENIGRCLQTMRERGFCRNHSCMAEYQCYIERRGQSFEPVYTLRCAKCKCRD
ncbi:unnamed protein product [Clonostachys chloroleuca]|uniref:BTB domain-containing protein n=1 Tax=Clonostachys chloroleuca TaxID=1926264 RepID=A0AA35LYS9_9HYPO|nr:unnamed protein product [Clonostachys chloroleuca]